MGTIKLENRGKNLATPEIVSTNVLRIGPYTFKDFNNLGLRIKLGYFYSPNVKLYLKYTHQSAINTTASTSIIYLKPFDKNVPIFSTELTGWAWSENLGYSKLISHSGTEADITVELPKLEYPYSVFLANRAGGGNLWSIFSNIMITEEPDAEFEPPRNDYIEFAGEMFGINSIYDELFDDGTLIKRWQRESITITSGAGTVSKTGTGTCTLVADSDGIPYEGTVSGTNVTTSAPDGEYTIIYQLEEPEAINLTSNGTGLYLVPGPNNLILPNFSVASFSATSNERIALNSLIGG